MGKVQCELCHKKCRGDVYKIAERFYHKECFTCKICGHRLDSGGFFMRDNSFYCKKDYSLYFSTKCKICLRDLDNEVVSALNASFHKDCFKCEICKTNFNPGDHVSVVNEQYYCFNCAHHAPKVAVKDENKERKEKSKTSIFSKEALKKRFFRSSSMDTRALSKMSPEPKDKLPEPDIPYPYLKDNLIIDTHLNSDQENVSPTTYPLHHDGSNFSKTLDSSSLHLYQSYLHLNECRARNAHDLYKRIPSLGTLPSETAYRPKQFHIPENRSMRNRSATSFGQRFTSLRTVGNVSNGHINHTNHSFQNMNGIKTSTPRTATLPNSVKSQTQHQSRASTLGLSTIHKNRPLKLSNLSTSAIPFSDGKSDEGIEMNGSRTFTPTPAIYDVTEEVRRLALFPDGYCRPDNVPAPIERLDWPAPASTGVVMAELMRERRRRKHASMKSSVSGVDFLNISSDVDAESHEALSIDASMNSSMAAVNESCSPDRVRCLTKSRQAKCKSVNLDLISASRSPSARVEPPYRTRFTDHHFASPSRDTTLLRDSLRSGSERLTYSLDYVAQPTRSATLLTNGSFAYFDGVRPNSNGYHNENRPHSKQNPFILQLSAIPESEIGQSTHYQSARYNHGLRSNSGIKNSTSGTILKSSEEDLSPTPVSFHHHSSMVLTHCMSPCSLESGDTSRMGSPVELDENTATLKRSDYIHQTDLDKELIGSTPSFPSVLFAATPSSVFKRQPQLPFKNHLSETEFRLIFRMHRHEFNHLPEWKRNDLKRRVFLF